MYTIEELVKAAPKLGFSKTLIEAALRRAGKKKFTLEEAQQIIEEFATQEVK